jgi:hypothetical protein
MYATGNGLAFISQKPSQISKLRIHDFVNLPNLFGNATQHGGIVGRCKAGVQPNPPSTDLKIPPDAAPA